MDLNTLLEESQKNGSTLIVDPPGGWQYGFPQPLQKDYKQQLIDAGYPESQIEFALDYSRYWSTDEHEGQIDHGAYTVPSRDDS